MTPNYTQPKELTSFYNTIELIKVLCNVIKHIFRLFRYVTQFLVHWANNLNNSNWDIPKRSPKEKAIHCMRLKQQIYSI